VLGDKVITKLPGSLAGGVQELGLADGAVLRTLDTKADIGFPDPEFRYPNGASRVFQGTQITFASDLPKQLGTQVCVFDLEKWSEVGRFRIAPVRGEVLAVDGRVLGFFWREEEEKFARAFSVDLAQGEVFTLPLRTNHLVPKTVVLPDGSRLVDEGRLNSKCGYDGFWPQMAMARVSAVGGRVLAIDQYGLVRVDPRDGRELWRLPLAPAKRRFTALFAGAEDVLAFGSGSYVYLIDAEKGTLRAAMRVLDGFKTVSERLRAGHRMRLACDGKRVYFSSAKGLMAFSTRPVERGRPDPDDPADPASAIAASRAAAVAGDFETALRAIHGASVSVLLRPECRGEFAALISQLSRSPAVEKFPGLWTDVMLTDGWVCGELFLQEYEKLLDQHATKRHAVAALTAMGGKAALKLVDAKLDTKRPTPFLPQAARARWKLTGVRPLGELLARDDVYDVSHLFEPPLEEAEFRLHLPVIQQKRKSWLGKYVKRIPPEWAIAILEGSTEGKSLDYVAAAAKAQVESRARGTGVREEIEITAADAAPAKGEF
jgi:hypothetical protein